MRAAEDVRRTLEVREEVVDGKASTAIVVRAPEVQGQIDAYIATTTHQLLRETREFTKADWVATVAALDGGHTYNLGDLNGKTVPELRFIVRELATIVNTNAIAAATK